MQSLLLALDKWDLCVDVQGNIAICSAPYSIQQDVANACRTYIGECWYDTRLGVPYNETILGKRPPLQIVKANIERVSLLVPGVVSAKCLFSSFTDRALHGQVQIVDNTGTQTIVQF